MSCVMREGVGKGVKAMVGIALLAALFLLAGCGGSAVGSGEEDNGGDGNGDSGGGQYADNDSGSGQGSESSSPIDAQVIEGIEFTPDEMGSDSARVAEFKRGALHLVQQTAANLEPEDIERFQWSEEYEEMQATNSADDIDSSVGHIQNGSIEPQTLAELAVKSDYSSDAAESGEDQTLLTANLNYDTEPRRGSIGKSILVMFAIDESTAEETEFVAPQNMPEFAEFLDSPGLSEESGYVDVYYETGNGEYEQLSYSDPAEAAGVVISSNGEGGTASDREIADRLNEAQMSLDEALSG